MILKTLKKYYGKFQLEYCKYVDFQNDEVVSAFNLLKLRMRWISLNSSLNVCFINTPAMYFPVFIFFKFQYVAIIKIL